MKIHVLRDLTAYYLKNGRQWVVKIKGKETFFDRFEYMIEAYPDLMELPVMQTTKERRSREKFKPIRIDLLKTIPQRPVDPRTEKIVPCYYCSGKGELFLGVVCPNCHGEKEIMVTTYGLL